MATFATDNLDVISENKDPDGKDVTVYGFGSAHISNIAERIKRISSVQTGRKMLPGAILLSLCASFDFQFADIMRFMLEEKGNRFVNSDKKLTIKEILSMGSIEDIKSKIIDDEIDAVMRSSHTDQAKFVEQNFHIKVIDDYKKWPIYIELFERRNLLAHGNLIVSSHYIGNCNAAKYNISDAKIGQVLGVSHTYLNKSVDLLMEYGLFIIISLWSKHFPDSKNDAYVNLNQTAYEMIQERRFGLASSILDFAFNSPKGDMKEATHKMITVNLANSYKKLKDEEKCCKILDGMDWSASSDDFQICVAALKEDINQVVNLIPRVAKSGSVEMEAFREWPVFDWVRDNDLVAEKFLEVFGEPLKLPKSSESAKAEASDSTTPLEKDVSETTVH